MRIDIAMSNVMDGIPQVGVLLDEIVPDVRLEPRENFIDSAARAYELLEEARGKIEAQVKALTDPSLAWPKFPPPQ